MNSLPRRLVLMAAFAALALSSALPDGGARAQTGRTIKIVAPFPPVGSVDILSRLLGEHISKAHGPTVIVENRPGAGAAIAYEAVARAAPDGNTVVINANSMVIVPYLRKVSFDALTSYEPICYMLRSPQVIVVNANAPYKTLSELIAAAKAQPGDLTMATVGPATTQHIGFELLRTVANMNMTYVPYAGGAPAINALLGGHVTAVLANYSEVVEQVGAGALRALATTSLRRIEPLPDVPAAAETYPGYGAEVWFGVVAPAKTPKDVTAELAAWFSEATQAPEVKPKLLKLGLYPVNICGADFTAHMKKQAEEYGRIIREAGIKPE